MRIVRSTLPDGTYWRYGYDAKGQVTAAAKHRLPGEVLHGMGHTYAFDEIGNRDEVTRIATTGMAAVTTDYTPNSVNQYAAIANPATLDVVGETDAGADVEINTVDALRQGSWFAGTLGAGETGSDWLAVTVDAEAPGGSPSSSAGGNLFLPAASVSPEHDADGNLLFDGRWDYTWDAENRLIGMTTSVTAQTAGVPASTIEHTYDGDSRRIATVTTAGSE